MSSKQFQEWRMGTVNIETGREDWRLEEAVRQVHRSKCIFTGIQEVRRLGQGNSIVEVPDRDQAYEVHWSGYARKHEAGVGIIIKKDPGIEVLNITYDSERLMSATLKNFGCNIHVIVGYSPTEEGSEYAKNRYYRQLRKMTRAEKKIKNQRLLVCGDFNATTSISSTHCSFRKSTFIENATMNANGVLFLEFCREFDLSVLNTHVQTLDMVKQ